MAQQEHGCGLGQSVSGETFAGVDCLFGHVEQQLPGAVGLRPEHPDGGLGKGVMGEKVQLETGAEGVVGQGGDRALHCRSGVGHQNIKATETAHAGVDRVLRGSGGGDVDGQPAMIAAQSGQRFGQCIRVAVHQKNCGPLRRKRPRGGQPDGPCAPCHKHDLAPEWWRRAAA